MKRFN